MGIKSLGVLLVFLLLMATVASAEIPDKIRITNNEWAIATGIDQVAITVHLYNATNTKVLFPGKTVNFNVVDPTLHAISTSAITGSDSNATSTFVTSTKSGRAQIECGLRENPGIKSTTYLNIDHNDPVRIVSPANYTGEITVGETINITIKLVDRYGNFVHNKNPNPPKPDYEKVDFTVSSPPGGTGAYFKNPLTPDFDKKIVTLTVDENGTISTPLKVDTVPGDNVVWVHPLSLAPDDYITILGAANGVPWYIDQNFPTTEESADGVKLFEFTYTLKRYHNPLPNKGLNWSARNSTGDELDREQPIFTNQMGWAKTKHWALYRGRSGRI